MVVAGLGEIVAEIVTGIVAGLGEMVVARLGEIVAEIIARIVAGLGEMVGERVGEIKVTELGICIDGIDVENGFGRTKLANGSIKKPLSWEAVEKGKICSWKTISLEIKNCLLERSYNLYPLIP